MIASSTDQTWPARFAATLNLTRFTGSVSPEFQRPSRSPAFASALFVRQARISRATRGRRILARSDRHDAGRRIGPFKPGDLPCKPVPGRGTRGRSVVNTARISERGGTMTAEKFCCRFRDPPGGGRSSDLIGYNAYFFFLLKQAPNGEKEIL